MHHVRRLQIKGLRVRCVLHGSSGTVNLYTVVTVLHPQGSKHGQYCGRWCTVAGKLK